MDAEAFCCWIMGKSLECQRVVIRARELASATGNQVVSFFIEGYGAADALSSGNLALAREDLYPGEVCLGNGRPSFFLWRPDQEETVGPMEIKMLFFFFTVSHR